MNALKYLLLNHFIKVFMGKEKKVVIGCLTVFSISYKSSIKIFLK